MTPRTVMKASADPRDIDRDPPMLDPESVLRNRRRVQIMLATGDHTWPRDLHPIEALIAEIDGVRAILDSMEDDSLDLGIWTDRLFTLQDKLMALRRVAE